MQKKDLIIIGGGIAGLYSAWRLAEKFNIILLEARDRFGGRIHSISSNWGIIEAGAEFVHGKAERSIGLLKKAGIKTIPVGGNFIQNENGKWKEEDDPHPVYWKKMLQQLGKAGDEETLGSFLDKNFDGDFLKDFRDRVRAYAEGFDVADPDKAAARALHEEWSHEGEGDLRVEGGYAALINFLLYELKDKALLRLNAPVARIDLTEDILSVILSSGEQLSTEAILVTIPVSLLSGKNNVSCIQLPAGLNTYTEAAQQIGFGGVIKVILECSQKFWPADMGFLVSHEVIPTWWSQLPSDKPILSGWAGGTKAAKIKDASEEQLKTHALHSLSVIFGLPVKEIESKIDHIHIFNWFNEPWSNGAYSYAYPQSAAARELLKKNYDKRIWFTGEGLYSGAHPGTVEAALVSADEAIESICAAI